MKKLPMILAVLLLSGCSALSLIPSKWDGNEAKSIIDIEMTAKYFDCANVKSQINDLNKQVEWFNTYSVSRGSNDIVALFEDLHNTVAEFKERTSREDISPLYCSLKKKIIEQQATIIAKAVQKRF